MNSEEVGSEDEEYYEEDIERGSSKRLRQSITSNNSENYSKELSYYNRKSTSKKSEEIESNKIESLSSDKNEKKIEWSIENELIMVEWCDNALCYKWMNAHSNIYYSYLNAWFTIPSIILSTISGTASFAQSSIPLEFRDSASFIIGSINIIVGILTTIQQYLKISELNEAHRVSSISWDKFARNIRIELSKSPDERMDAGHFLKLSRQEYDRLMETSPPINEKIIKKFLYNFSGKKDTVERVRFDELRKPDICNIIVSSNNYRHHWYKEIELSTNDFNKNIQNIHNIEHNKENMDEQFELKKQDLIKEYMLKESIIKQQLYEDHRIKEEELKNIILKQQEEIQLQLKEQFTKEQLELEKKLMENNIKEQVIKEEIIKEQMQKKMDEYIKEKEKEYSDRLVQYKKKEEIKYVVHKNAMDALKQFRLHKNIIDDFINNFVTTYGRKPLKDEIIENFNESKEINKEVLILYLDKYEDKIL
jgi:hypothetical protein